MAPALANALVPIFVGLLLGYWGGKRGWLDIKGVTALIAVVMNVAVPCAMFGAIIRTPWPAVAHAASACWIIALAYLVIYTATCLVALRSGKVSLSESAVLALTIGFPNCAAVAISLLSDLYGPSSRVLASLSIAVGALTISPITLAILEMQATPGPRSFDIRKFLKCILLSFKRPVVWAPLVALLLLAVHVSLPPFALSSLGVLGNASTGTALLLTGLILSEQKLQVNFGVIASSLAKVVVQPLIVLGICLLLRVEISTLRQVTMICATPAGFFGLVFGKRFQAAPAVAGSALILTYVLSIATLPLWAVIVTYIH
jgi:predicted permease